MVNRNPFLPPSQPEHQDDWLNRAHDIEAGTRLGLAIADELGVPTSDAINRDAVVSTVIAAIRRGHSQHHELIELARLSLITGPDD